MAARAAIVCPISSLELPMVFDSSATVEQVVQSGEFVAKVREAVNSKRHQYPEIDLDLLSTKVTNVYSLRAIDGKVIMQRH